MEHPPTTAPPKVVEAIQIAPRTRRIVWQNIGFAMGVKALFIALGAIGVATLWDSAISLLLWGDTVALEPLFSTFCSRCCCGIS
ncbi:MAG: hypothetical protein WBA99_00090 [Nodosilinea sp.]